MGFWDSVTGRTKPKKADLDSLFLVPSAAVTLETAAGLTPTGTGSVCFRAADGPAYRQVAGRGRLPAPGRPGPARRQRPDATSSDSPGWWSTACEDDVEGLCTDLHALNTTLAEQGFGDGLLCTVVPFADSTGRKVGLVYLYKQGTFYGFAPTGPKTRDNLLELQVRDTLAAELPMEPDLQRWLALWGAPGSLSLISRGGSGRAGRASAAGRSGRSARCRGRPGSG